MEFPLMILSGSEEDAWDVVAAFRNEQERLM
jgi:hypothetical protein